MRSYRIVANSRDRQAWLAARRQCSLTASEVATVMGCNPWETWEGLLKLKSSSIEAQQAADDSVGRKAKVMQGAMLEQATWDYWIAWERLQGFPVWGRHNTRFLVSAERPYLGATPDGLVRRGGRLQVVDLKRPGYFTLEKWKKSGVPDHYRAQLTCHQYVTGIRSAVLVGHVDAEPLALTVEWDPGWEQRMLTAVDQFHSELHRARRTA